MEQKTSYDVIIVGGGPAGLSIGSELSKDHEVLIIEKNTAGKTNRSWFVPLDVVDESIKPFTYGGVTRFLAKTFLGAELSFQAKLFDRYPYINENTILPHWVRIIENNNSRIIDNCTYQSHTVDKGIVSVETTKGNYTARLLIDASGYNSSIVKKYKINRKNFYWWSVFGAIGEHPNGIGNMKVGDYMMWQTFRDTNLHVDTSLENGRPVFEYEILNENTSFSLILYLRNEQMSRDVMEKEYMHVIRNEGSTRLFHDINIKELKYGWYPSGTLSQQIAEDHVVFVGDAGCWTTPCGWGMGFILDNYRYFSSQICKALADNTLSREGLLSIPHYKVHQKYEILMNAIATHFLSNASAYQLDKFINLFYTVNPILCEKTFTLKMTQEELGEMLKAVLKTFDVRELIHVIPKRDYLLILEEAKYFMEDSVIGEMHNMFDFLAKHNIKSNLNNGFDFS